MAKKDEELILLEPILGQEEYFQYDDPSKICLESRLAKVNINAIYKGSWFSFKSIVDVLPSKSTMKVSNTKIETKNIPLNKVI